MLLATQTELAETQKQLLSAQSELADAHAAANLTQLENQSLLTAQSEVRLLLHA